MLSIAVMRPAFILAFVTFMSIWCLFILGLRVVLYLVLTIRGILFSL